MTSDVMASRSPLSTLLTVHTVGELLRQWRQRRKLSQLDLAITADVSARHVSLVETGKSQPSAGMILRLAEHLQVPLRERNRLLLAGGFAPRYAERPLDDKALAAAHDASVPDWLAQEGQRDRAQQARGRHHVLPVAGEHP